MSTEGSGVGEALPASVVVSEGAELVAPDPDYLDRTLDDAERAVGAALKKIEKQEEHLQAAKDAHAQAVADLEALREGGN